MGYICIMKSAVVYGDIIGYIIVMKCPCTKTIKIQIMFTSRRLPYRESRIME